MHRRLYLTAAAFGLSAFAAAAPASAQESPFSGWYVGLNLGSAWGDNSQHATIAPGSAAVPAPPIVIPPADVALINAAGSGNNNKSGLTFGAEGGYNYVSENWLFGIETDIGTLDINERQTNNFTSVANPAITYSINQRAQTKWIWTLRPRIGYTAGPWLFYGTGGIATADIKNSLSYSDTRTPPNSASSESSSTKTGWTAGIGGAYAVTPNWSFKGEWLYVDIGKINTSVSTASGFATLNSEANVKANVLRIGTDYRF